MNIVSATLRGVTLTVVLLLSACSQTPEKQTNNRTAEATDSLLSDRHQRAVESIQVDASRGDYQAARSTLERLLEQQPGHPDLWANLAALHHQLDEPEACARALKRARELAPDNAQALNLEGTLALENDDVDTAKEWFRRAVQSEPEHPEAHYNLALLYDTYYQDLERAVHHYQAYLQFSAEPDDATADWLKQLQSALERQHAQEQDG